MPKRSVGARRASTSTGCPALGRKIGERRAGADGGIDSDLAAMLADDLEHRGEAEAGAMPLGREERVENLLEVLRRDAAAVVLHLELHVVARGQRGNLIRGQRGIGGAYPDMARAALGHRLNGVDHQILENLEELGAVPRMLPVAGATSTATSVVAPAAATRAASLSTVMGASTVCTAVPPFAKVRSCLVSPFAARHASSLSSSRE